MSEQIDSQLNEPVRNSKNIWAIVIPVIVTALVAGGGVYIWQKSVLKNTEQNLQEQITSLQSQVDQFQQKETANQPIVNQYIEKVVKIPEFMYSNINNFPISKEEFNVLQRFTPAQLESDSKGCGTNKSQSYFQNLLSHFSPNDKGVIYKFNYFGPTQGRGFWQVTVIPNKIGYTDVDSFSSDFGTCYAGGLGYTKLVSENYLLFVSSCGTGVEDSSGLPHGCNVVQELIEHTIKLK